VQKLNAEYRKKKRIYYTCSITCLTENVFPLSLALTLTLTETLNLKHNNIFGTTNDAIFEKVYRYRKKHTHKHESII